MGRYRRADGVLGALLTVSSTAPGESAVDSQVALDPDGDAIVVWERELGATTGIRARIRSAGGSVGPITEVAGDDYDHFDPRVGMDGQGAAVVAWQMSRPGLEPNIVARRRSASGTWGGTQGLSFG